MSGLNTLKRYTTRAKPSVGRGGKRGKTSGRGTKGQNARSGHKKRPEIRDFIKKLPKRRGYGKNRSRTTWDGKMHAIEVTLSQLDKAFTEGDSVTPKILFEKGLIRSIGGKIPDVKILATGSVTKKLLVSESGVSAGARKAIEAIGGTIS